MGGARSDLSPAPSVDIANGAPTGTGASNRIALSWVDGRTLNHETVQYSSSTNGGSSWEPARAIQTGNDRGYYSAPSISPDGRDVYVVYNAFTSRSANAEGPATSAGSSAWCCTPTRRSQAPRPRSRRCIAARPVTPAAPPRTTWPPSSSATTSTRRRPTTTGPACGTTCATAPTARRSTSTARRSTRRRWPRAGGRPRPRSRAARPCASTGSRGRA